MSKRKTNGAFVEELKFINPTIIPLEKYVTGNTPILCKCNICNNEWKASATNLLRGRRCPKCFGKNKYLLDEFKDKLNSINASIEVVSDEYVNSKTKLKCKCKVCGSFWEATPGHLLDGTACPKCENYNTSYVEKYIYYSFVYALGEDKVVSRDRKAIGKELDIYIPSLKLAIEPGAWKWHKNKLESDLGKLKQCEENGIHLLIIYDGCTECCDSDLVISYEEDLGQRKNESILQKLILDILISMIN